MWLAPLRRWPGGARWLPAAGCVLPRSPASLALQRQHGGRVHPLDHLALAGPTSEVHVHPAGQARVEAADSPHDVDALEVVGLVLLEDRGVLHRVLVGS